MGEQEAHPIRFLVTMEQSDAYQHNAVSRPSISKNLLTKITIFGDDDLLFGNTMFENIVVFQTGHIDGYIFDCVTIFTQHLNDTFGAALINQDFHND